MSEDDAVLQRLEAEHPATATAGPRATAFIGRGQEDPAAPNRRGNRSVTGWRNAINEGDRFRVKLPNGSTKRQRTLRQAVEYLLSLGHDGTPYAAPAAGA